MVIDIDGNDKRASCVILFELFFVAYRTVEICLSYTQALIIELLCTKSVALPAC